MKDVWKMEVVDFEAVSGNVREVPDQVLQQLSHDQQILHQLARAVQDGSMPAQTACKRIGKLNHAR